jgi:hypothetical protein
MSFTGTDSLDHGVHPADRPPPRPAAERGADLPDAAS